MERGEDSGRGVSLSRFGEYDLLFLSMMGGVDCQPAEEDLALLYFRSAVGVAFAELCCAKEWPLTD